MAKVDTIDGISQSLRPEFQQPLTARATPDAFGASAYAGLSSVSAGLDKVASVVDAVDKLNSDNKLKKVEVSAATEDLDTKTNYEQLQGGAAVAGKDAAMSAFDATTKKFAAGLTPQELNKWELARGERALQIKGAIIQHAAGERTKDTLQTSQSVMDAAKSDAISFFNDPKRRDVAIQNGLAEIDRIAPMAGISGARLDGMKKDYTSGAYAGIIGRMVEADPLAAQKFYDANRDKITGETQAKIDAVLKDGVINEQSKQEAKKIVDKERGVPGAADDPTQGGAQTDGMAARVVRGYEGWTDGKWDVNHWRVGYSSDTVTKEDGSVQKVTPGTTVSHADADRDLQRRLKEQENVYISRGGEENWNKLSDGAKAAAQSVAWNYGIDGSAPRDIMAAIARGEGDAGVANAIKMHRHDNSGVNMKRRDEEADLAAGGKFSGGMIQKMTAADRFASRQRMIDGITNPDVAAATQKRLNLMDTAQKAAEEADAKDAKDQLWKMIDAGKTPDDISPELRQRAGMAATTEAWSYIEKRTAAGGQDKVESDEELLYKMRKQAAEDPLAFSKVDLMEYRSRLKKTDLTELENKQTTYTSDRTKVTQEGVDLSTAFQMSERQLKAAGLTGMAKDNDPAGKLKERQTEAQFQNALSDGMADWSKTHPGVKPTQMDIQQLINRMMMPVIMRTTAPRSWGGYAGGDTDEPGHFAFQMRTADPAVKAVPDPIILQQLDRGTRKLLVEGFSASHAGREPSQDELLQMYVDFLQSGH